jgi:glutamyl-tRNA reductase
VNGLSCLSVAGCQASLDLLERLAYPRIELAERVTAIRTASGAHAVAVLSTCQRTELYATWPDAADDGALLRALAADRGVPCDALRAAARFHHGDAAARHLFRVATGLESFVLGETEIAGQVRTAAEVSRAAGGRDVVLERLMDAAVSASRKRQRNTSVAATSRSVASVAVDAAVTASGGTIAGRRLLIVGAGDVATVVVSRAVELGALVTVCNRSRRHADRFIRAGALMVDLGRLVDCLATSDIAILATAAPHPLVDAHTIRSARGAGAGPLTLLDLSLPRNVDPSVRTLPSVRLIDLVDLRAGGATDAGDLADDVALTEAIIESEVLRYQRWRSSRTAAGALQRMRSDAEAIARQELARIAPDTSPDVQAAIERALLRTVHRLVHGPTREVLAAAKSGDERVVRILAGLYGPTPLADGTASAAGDPDATRRLGRLPFDVERPGVRTVEQPGDERVVHAAHEIAM